MHYTNLRSEEIICFVILLVSNLGLYLTLELELYQWYIITINPWDYVRVCRALQSVL